MDLIGKLPKVTKILSITVFSLFTIYMGKIWYSYRFFKRKGLKTPPYTFLSGNLLTINKNKNFTEVIHEWTKEYGKTYGYYEGHQPVLVTSDLDIIQEMFVKQYSNFAAKKKNPISRQDDHDLVPVSSAIKGRWKRMRNIMNPTFSTSKMKLLAPSMENCVKKLIMLIDKSTSQEINVLEIFRKFTLDTLWNCAFSIDNDIQNTSNGDMYIACSLENTINLANYTPLMYFVAYFYEFRRYIIYFRDTYNKFVYKYFQRKVDPFYKLCEEIYKIVDKRREENTRKVDYLQLLVDAQCDITNELSHTDSESNFAQMNLSNKLSSKEIKINLAIFLVAGFETTSMTLSSICYMLALYQEEQETLYNEINSVHLENHESLFDALNKLKYLDMVIKETLRMYPVVAPITNRRCVNATKIKDLEIPEGLPIVVDVLSIHYDPEIYGPVDPNLFYPLRFSPDYKRNPLAYMAFSQGPRQCLGMKFALMQLKMAVFMLIKNFKIEKTENTPNKLNFIDGAVRFLTSDINLKFKKRDFFN